MHVIAKPFILAFIDDYPDSASSLLAWHREAETRTWTTPNEVRESFATASFVGRLVVFNIAGNKYRLITDIHYNIGKVYIDQILTHAEYDRGLWKRG